MSSQEMPALISLEPYDPRTALPEALSLLAEAAVGEREDELFYDYLLGRAQREEDIKVITDIRDDERKHNLLFRQIYAQLTGSPALPAPEPEFEPPADYCDGLRRAIFGELAAVEKYRRILFGLSFNQVFANVLTEIYTDELKHAVKWNYLFCRNGCCETEEAGD